MSGNGNGKLRIGVFVCDCGLNIAGAVDCGEVTDYARDLPGVVCVIRNKYTCADPGRTKSSTPSVSIISTAWWWPLAHPRQHEPTFRQCVADAGMNPYLMEMANLREHCSWVHPANRGPATEKAKDLVASAVARAAFLEPQEEMKVPGNQGDAGDRRWRRRDRGRPRNRRRRPQSGPRRKGAFYWRDHGPARQDLSHHGLLYMNFGP